MNNRNNLTSLAFQPWAADNSEHTSLKETLSRVNLERGHFRNITETSLLEEIAAEGGLELSESEDDDGDQMSAEEDQGVHDKPATREELFQAKREMWEHVKSAENEVATALDFVSLLLSKDAPSQGRATMSPALKQKTEPGTLGIDIWQRMSSDQAKVVHDEMLASNVRIISLQQSANGLLAAATGLEDNVRKETKYWEQVLSIADKGWNISRIPRQAHRLAVTFGFSESSPGFSRRGAAGLNTDSDGNLTLERGIGAKPIAMRVLLKKDNKIVGKSRLPSWSDDGESTLETGIRQARDSLFDEELYHEMIRESRSIASLGVFMIGDTICYRLAKSPPNDWSTLCFEMVELDKTDALRRSKSDEQDTLAQAIAVSARLLLGQAHRDRLKKRSEVPPPLFEKKEEQSTLLILRPIMSFMLHQTALSRADEYLDRIARVMSAAAIEYQCSKAYVQFPEFTGSLTADSLIARLMQPWVSDAALQINSLKSARSAIRLRFETTLTNNLGPIFTLTVPGDRSFQYEDAEELQSAADWSLALNLASELGRILGDGWKCNTHEPLLTKSGDKERKCQSTWVTVDGREGTLSLSTSTKKVMWSVEGDGPGTSFWDASRDLLRG